MERFGSMLMRTWNNNDKKKTLINNNNNNNDDYDHDDDDLSSWEIININPKPNNNIIITPHDDHHDDDDHDDDHVLLQQHGLSLSKYDIDRPRSDDNNHSLAIGSQYDHTTNMVSDELKPFQNNLNATGPSSSSSSTAFLITHPFPIDAICDPVCNRKLDHEEKEENQVHKSINYDDVEDNDDEEYDDYDYDDDSRWLRKQRMTKVGKKVNNGMMKKSNKLPRYFYNKFV